MVLDASALVDWLLGTPGRGSLVAAKIAAAGQLHTVDFVDLEIVSALRRKALAGEDLTPQRAQQALDRLGVSPLLRHRTAQFVPRAWTLRHTHTPYDAAYIALAELLRVPLLTTDTRLARSRGHRAEIIEPTA